MGYRRFVALGDSTTEGLEDRYENGEYRGWADRLAERLVPHHPDLLYANLAVRGKLARQVREDQLDAALALRPDLASLLVGLNDCLRRSIDVHAVAGEIETMVSALRGIGADVILVGLPDPVPINPLARIAVGNVIRLNVLIRDIAARHGALLIDLEAHPVVGDRRLWDRDRLHGNPEGHRRIAAAAAELLALPGSDHSWALDYADRVMVGRGRRIVEHAVWAHVYFRPWLMRRVRGRSSGDGRAAKRPQLEPMM